MRYFLGLDGGGTKTHVLFYDAKDGVMDLITGAASNYENMAGGYAELAIVLKDMIIPFLARRGVSPADIDSAAFGMGGVDSVKQHDEITKILTGLGFGKFVLSNDAYLGVKAGTSRGFGISCVGGSGYSVVGVGTCGKMLQVGGMGQVTGDRGGAFWLVPEAIRYAHGQLFRRFPASLMTPAIVELLGKPKPVDFMEALHEQYFNGDEKAFTLAVCKIIFSAANQQDTAAVALLEQSGQAYGESILGILDNLTFDGAPEIVLTGSLFQKYPDSPIVTRLCSFLTENYAKPFTTHVLDAPSVLGALFWAMGDISTPERMRLRKMIEEHI
ncbi:MAG: hypothetical protein FWC73_07510 [Defluviitaleaceae bacterium]|nr:hypothetical protein [Defluviitaleaceae bacterium]